jgi:hypothetical protein
MTGISSARAWKTTTRGDREFLKVGEHEIEIMALDRIVTSLGKDKFIGNGERPGIGIPSREKFFDQFKDKVGEQRYRLLEELEEWVRRREEFDFQWGGGKAYFTMNLIVKRWGIPLIAIDGDGSAAIGYQANPALSRRWWELPHETQTVLRQLFKHKTQKWPDIPLRTQADVDNLKKALEILAEHSKRLNVIWHEEGTGQIQSS